MKNSLFLALSKLVGRGYSIDIRNEKYYENKNGGIALRITIINDIYPTKKYTFVQSYDFDKIYNLSIDELLFDEINNAINIMEAESN